MEWDEVSVPIPDGWFRMGSDDSGDDERPVHDVWAAAFKLAVCPVPGHVYERFLRATGHEAPRDWDLFAISPDRPVVGVSWLDCQTYCRWREGEGDPVQLPTEAEWERAARGGVDGQRYPWGDAIPAWIPNGGRGPLDGPWPVTLGEPNPFGLFGIAANVHEWCADCYASDYYRLSPNHQPVRRAQPDRSVLSLHRHGFRVARLTVD